MPPWPVLTVCHHDQGVALPDKLSHTASSFITRRPQSWSWTARIHHNTRVDSCHPPSTSASAHEVGHLHTYPKPHAQKQFTSLINISDLSLVKCFVPRSEEFVSAVIFSTLSFPLRIAALESQVLNLDATLFCF